MRGVNPNRILIEFAQIRFSSSSNVNCLYWSKHPPYLIARPLILHYPETLRPAYVLRLDWDSFIFPIQKNNFVDDQNTTGYNIKKTLIT